MKISLQKRKEQKVTSVLPDGRCALCRTITTHKKSGRLNGKKQVPITDGNVIAGRCLRCHPFQPLSRVAVVLKYSHGDYVGQVLITSCPPIIGRKDGKGLFQYKNGDVYKGNFKYDQPWGMGTFVYSNGNKYEGQFRKGKPHGQGTFTDGEGGVYKGHFKGGKKEGRGMKWQDGILQYDGDWCDDKEDAPIYRSILC
uniref:MORN repeat-containing protein 5 n=1 Tax=Proboscia inermis TaxID=420281 RepID=A0A7S0CMV8_9STRA|mmetsp:Transcript_9769/g.9861  ORF Transcript_9769/g.9861 Transcript_9769/m.9861 type:complete len:197 (+) Transcript_9769:140-730(+)